MGKVEDLRKMREARYLMRHGMVAPSEDASQAAAESLAEVGKAVREGAAKRGRKVSDLTADLDLCGHKGVGGKTCTRPKDHQEKNHRYK